jgi:hypothetical protein
MTDIKSQIQTAINVTQTVRQLLVLRRVERIKQGLNPDKSPTGDPPSLAHYTTADGLYGIIQNGTLRASAAYYLNDSSEMDYGCQLFTEMLDEAIIDADNSQDTVRKKVCEDTKKAFVPGGYIESLIYRTYVACFCEDDNLLSQWRAYGQNGGYSLTFPGDVLSKSLTVSDEFYYVELQRVIYDKKIQNQLLQLVLSDLLSIMNDKRVSTIYDNADYEGKINFVSAFYMMLQTIAVNEIVRFKHPAFAGQKEWRLIVRPMSTNLSTKEIEHLRFRTARGMMVPYLELRPKEGTLLPITSIQYGPTLDKKRVMKSLDLLFKQKGYPDIPVIGSEIPVILP